MSYSRVFDRIYQDYLMQVRTLDFDRVVDCFGLHWEEEGLAVPFLVSCIRSCPTASSTSRESGPVIRSAWSCANIYCCVRRWGRPAVNGATYKDFKDAAPFVSGFRNYAEKPLEQSFAGRPAILHRASLELGGKPVTGYSSDYSFQFEALPRLPLLLLFNDQDEEFPAHCSILFQKRADKFLDMEVPGHSGMDPVRVASGKGLNIIEDPVYVQPGRFKPEPAYRPAVKNIMS